MYRIELSPGEETAFRSIEELAVAIRRNVVTSRARIYHHATGKWLPIQFHPHYKLATSMPLTQADLVAGPPVAPLSALNLGESATKLPDVPLSATREAATQAALSAWPEPKPHSPPVVKPVAQPAKPVAQPARKDPELSKPPIQLGTPAPEPRRVVEPLRPAEMPRVAEPRRVLEPHRVVEPRRVMVPHRVVEPRRSVEQTRTEEPRAKSSRRRRKPSRSLRVALAGAVLIACGQLAVSAVSTSSPEVAALLRTPRRLIEVPAEALKDVRPRTVAAVMPGLQSIPVPSLKTTTSPARAPEASVPKPTPVDSVSISDSVPEIQPAPHTAGIAVPVPTGAESLAPPVVDSSGKKAMKGILRTIGGSPAVEAKRPKR
jgi:hypothetical protein